MIPYIYATHFIVILSTTAITPHLLPISFYLINKETSNHFKELDVSSYSIIYSFFNTSYRIQNLIIIFLIMKLINFGYMLIK